MRIYHISPDVDPALVKEFLDKEHSHTYLPLKEEADIIAQCADAEVLIPIYEPITRNIIASLPHLRHIAVASIGYDRVDLEAAKDYGVLVTNNPLYCVEDVADHTVGLILALTRQIVGFDAHVRQGGWDYDAFGNTLERLGDHTVGLLGFGNIGRRVARRLKGFGCRIIAHDPYVDEEVFLEEGVEPVDRDLLLREATILSLHVPSTEETRGMGDEGFFSACEKRPFLVSTARGDVCQNDAILKALESGQLRGAALDVWEGEGPHMTHPLFSRKDVIFTPHSAFYSRASHVDAARHVARSINDAAKGKTSELPIVSFKD